VTTLGPVFAVQGRRTLSAEDEIDTLSTPPCARIGRRRKWDSILLQFRHGIDEGTAQIKADYVGLMGPQAGEALQN
jgi:hypothetical protein